MKPFLYLFFRCYVVRIILFKCKCGEKESFLHMSEERGNARRHRLLYRYIWNDSMLCVVGEQLPTFCPRHCSIYYQQRLRNLSRGSNKICIASKQAPLSFRELARRLRFAKMKLKHLLSLKWCIKGECVDDGSPMIDGGWSDWQDTQSCTQTCGGGVQWKTRTCTNPV